MYSPSIKNLISAFSKLPSVGSRTAERYVFYLLKSGKKDAAELALSIKNLLSSVKSCGVCWSFSDRTPCLICSDKNRDQSTICVVEEPQDMEVIENTGNYFGMYHVLRGLIEPGDEETLTNLKVGELIARLRPNEIKEIILAFNADLSGETTMMFLERQIRKNNPKIIITRLARGLPMGSDLEYADEITLSNAIKHRTKI